MEGRAKRRDMKAKAAPYPQHHAAHLAPLEVEKSKGPSQWQLIQEGAASILRTAESSRTGTKPLRLISWTTFPA